MMSEFRSPGIRLGLAGLVGLIVFGFVVFSALNQPWLGLTLRWDREHGGARVLASEGPAAHIAPGSLIHCLSTDDGMFELSALDFTEEPDASLPDFETYRAFLARQEALFGLVQRALVHKGKVALAGPDLAGARITPASRRPLPSLPHELWIQVCVGVFAWLISAGVWAYRPKEASARYLLLCGFATLLFAPLAGVYSTRELALPANLFLCLSDLNFLGGSLYCGGMVALLLVYPKRLVKPQVAPLLVLAFVLWFVAQELGAFESMLVSRRTPVFVSLLATFALSLVQHRITKGDPVARASFSWFLLSWLLGTSLFVGITMVPQLFGADMGALQGYGFSLFLLVYGGLAFGILRFRLFELGEWWFRTFTWVLGALLLFSADLLLMMLFAVPGAASFGVSIVLVGFVWLPMRGFVWRKVVSTRRKSETPDLFKHVIKVAFASRSEERIDHWKALLLRMFDPLHAEVLDSPPAEVCLDRDGLCLLVPAVGDTPGFVLSYAERGLRLFSPHDQKALAQAVSMLRYVDENREAYSRGAREERSRIAQDLHDDIGSRLLTGLHQEKLEATKESIGQAMLEMRTLLHGLAGTKLRLLDVLAELRSETSQRLEAAKITLIWPPAEDFDDLELEYSTYKQYLSVMRELFSNTIRHAHASKVWVRISLSGEQLASEVRDDGCGFDEAAVMDGYGIANMRRRLALLGGSLRYTRLEQGVSASLALSCAASQRGGAHATA